MSLISHGYNLVYKHLRPRALPPILWPTAMEGSGCGTVYYTLICIRGFFTSNWIRRQCLRPDIAVRFGRDWDLFTTLRAIELVTFHFHGNAIKVTALHSGTEILSPKTMYIWSHGYKLVYKERFRRKFPCVCRTHREGNDEDLVIIHQLVAVAW